ncbi:hypothetical protein [Labedaea rhizosphaerae]|uniref:Uncharacterized protein n=1 Tax=Labedaea rhizosphaerae TaxID=598644 RepID=A0A4R6SMU3_LABRH|nr:hypothetical protein [Labedaea rhizosphaerae]TDQ05221.1 hypothetical protein EV186_1011189 [Labedaea rhizosphaerae]
MRRRFGALAGAGALVLGVAMAGLTATSGTAQASSPIVVGDCSTTIEGTPGQPIQLSTSAVVQPVANIIGAVPILGPPLKKPFTDLFNALPPIPIGGVQNGTTVITGGTIATQVVTQLKKIPLLGPVLGLIVGSVQQTLTSLCGVTVTVANDVGGVAQDGSAAVEQGSTDVQKKLGIPGAGGSGGGGGGGSTGPGGGGSGGGSGAGSGNGPVTQMPHANNPVVGGLGLGDVQLYDPNGLPYNFGRSPMAMYANLPFAQPGLFSPTPGAQYGSSVPGYSPQFGILGGNGQPDGVEAAGHAEALDAPSGDRVAFPVLLAVLALSGVTAALVRTWVLRRTIAS